MENFSLMKRKLGSLEYVELTSGKRQRKEKKIFDPSDGDPSSKEKDNSSKKTKKKSKEVITITDNNEELLTVDDLFNDDVFSEDNNNKEALIAKPIGGDSFKTKPLQHTEIQQCSVLIKRLSSSSIKQYVKEEKVKDPEEVDDLVNFFAPDNQDNFVECIDSLEQKKNIFLCKQGHYLLFDSENLLKLHNDSIHKFASCKIRCPSCSVLMYGSGYEVHVLAYHKEEWKKYPKLYNINPKLHIEPITKPILSKPAEVKPILPKLTQVPSPEKNLSKNNIYLQSQDEQRSKRIWPTKIGSQVNTMQRRSKTLEEPNELIYPWDEIVGGTARNARPIDSRRSKTLEEPNELIYPWDEIVGETARNTRAIDRDTILKVRKTVPKEIYKPENFKEEECDLLEPLKHKMFTAINRDSKQKLSCLTNFDNTSFYRKYLEITRKIRFLSKRIDVQEKDNVGRLEVSLVKLKAQLIQLCAHHPGPQAHVNTIGNPTKHSFYNTEPKRTLLTKSSDSSFSVKNKLSMETEEKQQVIEVINSTTQKWKPIHEPSEAMKIISNNTPNKIDSHCLPYTKLKKLMFSRKSPSLLVNKDQNSSLLIRNTNTPFSQLVRSSTEPQQVRHLMGRVNGLKIIKQSSGESKASSKLNVVSPLLMQKQCLSDVIVPSSTVVKSEPVDEEVAHDPLEISPVKSDISENDDVLIQDLSASQPIILMSSAIAIDS